MTVSLVVATIGRRQELARLLESLREQTFKDFTIVIVDQNSPGYLDEILQQYAGVLPINVITAPPQGVSRARNAGMEHAAGEIICFPDDDCWYAPHTLERIITLFETFPHVGGWLVSWKHFDQKQEDLRIIPVNMTNAFQRAGTLVQFYRRKEVQGIQFDATLGPGTGLPYGSGEDTDFLLQVLKRNVPVRKTSEVLVYHAEPDIVDAMLIPKTDTYAQGRMHLLRKHKFPLYVQVIHIVYPLARLIVEGPKAWKYRRAMCSGRLRAFLRSRDVK